MKLANRTHRGHRNRAYRRQNGCKRGERKKAENGHEKRARRIVGISVRVSYYVRVRIRGEGGIRYERLKHFVTKGKTPRQAFELSPSILRKIL